MKANTLIGTYDFPVAYRMGQRFVRRVLKLRNYTVARGPVRGQKKRLPRNLSVRVVREGRMLRTVELAEVRS